MKLRFFKAMAITGIMALSSLSALPMATSAITDPNGDGTLSIADALVIQRYLSGTGNYSNLSALDFNGDCVIDARDQAACTRYVTGMDY